MHEKYSGLSLKGRFNVSPGQRVIVDFQMPGDFGKRFGEIED